MALEDRNRRGLKRLVRSFRYATAGLLYVIKNEQNMQIHLVGAVFVLLLGWFFSIDRLEWMILLLVIGSVLTVETFNTAIERTIDFVTEEYHPLAKRAKDVAAASVFLFCIIAALVGMIIFIPYISEFIIGASALWINQY